MVCIDCMKVINIIDTMNDDQLFTFFECSKSCEVADAISDIKYNSDGHICSLMERVEEFMEFG